MGKPEPIDDPLPPIELVDGEPVFRVFVLGTGNAGKTVFLASLYKQLSLFNRRNYYRVWLDSDEQRDSLQGKYEEIARPDADWPTGTLGPTDYDFRCFYPVRNVDFEIFRFRYADYRGGAVAGKRLSQDSFSVRDACKAAHTILVLIDGHKVYNKLNHIDDGGPTVDDDFNATLDIIQPWIRRPLQFVISKHDLLTGYDLQTIRAALLGHRGFRDVVDYRRELAIATHLIPVSAVGPDFAVWDARAGKMRKKAGASPDPYNIDLTLSLTISDALLTRFKQEESQADVFRRTLIKAAIYGRKGFNILMNLLPWIPEDIWVLRIVALWNAIDGRLNKQLSTIEEEINARTARIKDKNSAIDGIIQVQRLLHTKFYQANRASNLLEDA